MTDALDKAFASDMEKIGKGLPSELAQNAARVSAAQTDKKGAEKPDLYGGGKGTGKDGKPAKDEENDERKSKGPNKGDKKDPNAPDKSVGAKSKDDVEKKASIDDEFNGHMHQVVGLDVPEAREDFERPNVKIAGQTNDAIDDHFKSYFDDKAAEDVVKEASVGDSAVAAMRAGTSSDTKKRLAKYLAGAGAVGLAAGGAGGYAAGKKGKKDSEKKAELDKEAMCGADHSKLKKGEKCGKCGKSEHAMPDGSVMKDKDHKKEAGVIEHPENLDLLGRIRRKAAGGLVVGSGDV